MKKQIYNNKIFILILSIILLVLILLNLKLKVKEQIKNNNSNFIDYRILPKIENIEILTTKSTFTKEQTIKWLKKREAPQIFIENIDLFYEIGEQEGINASVLITQTALETNFMKYTGVVPQKFHNTSGLKIRNATGDLLNDHAIFSSWREGILAHAQHLALYAGAKDYPLTKEKQVDPRHFDFLYATAPTVQDLSQKWAPSKEYGQRIIDLLNEINNLGD